MCSVWVYACWVSALSLSYVSRRLLGISLYPQVADKQTSFLKPLYQNPDSFREMATGRNGGEGGWGDGDSEQGLCIRTREFGNTPEETSPIPKTGDGESPDYRVGSVQR